MKEDLDIQHWIIKFFTILISFREENQIAFEHVHSFKFKTQSKELVALSVISKGLISDATHFATLFGEFVFDSFYILNYICAWSNLLQVKLQ